MGMSDGVEQELRVLTDGAEEVLPTGVLAERLKAARAEDRPLRVKLGIDPSSPHLTLGHAVVLRKLVQFQRFGHTVVLIIGNFTGLVGDPSGRSQTRNRQTEVEVADHIRTYLDQVGKILDVSAAEVRHNAEWLAPMTFSEVADLAANVTVARLLEREDFKARYSAGRPISLVEFLYPLMQAMDSVAIHADVELGGTDQTFNLLIGRELQRAHGQAGQVVLTMPLLRGTDGVQKMSKSLSNSINLDDPPEEQFGKLMRIPDHLVPEYLRLCADLDPDETEKLIHLAAQGGAPARDVKRRLARQVTQLYHGADNAARAEAAFDAGVASRRGASDVSAAADLSIPAGAIGGDGRVRVVPLLAEAGLAGSRGEARRLVGQGAVRLDGQPVASIDEAWSPTDLDGRVLTVGRRAPLRLRAIPG
jgi:tyrosyl-tRNA synthetase